MKTIQELVNYTVVHNFPIDEAVRHVFGKTAACSCGTTVKIDHSTKEVIVNHRAFNNGRSVDEISKLSQ
jgi:hypothetical protein